MQLKDFVIHTFVFAYQLYVAIEFLYKHNKFGKNKENFDKNGIISRALKDNKDRIRIDDYIRYNNFWWQKPNKTPHIFFPQFNVDNFLKNNSCRWECQMLNQYVMMIDAQSHSIDLDLIKSNPRLRPSGVIE